MKTFLSIGAGPGIGFATAQRFAREGFRIILAARSTARLEALKSRLESDGFKADVITVDVADDRQVSELISTVEQRHGGIDVLHYNAAVMRQASLNDQPQSSFSTDLAINIAGAAVAAQAALPAMRTRGFGTILFTGGGFALAPHPDYLSLSIGKAGIRALAQGLFEPARAEGVHVATVTVAAFVQPESAEATGVAEAFWTLYSQEAADWQVEAVYSA